MAGCAHHPVASSTLVKFAGDFRETVSQLGLTHRVIRLLLRLAIDLVRNSLLVGDHGLGELVGVDDRQRVRLRHAKIIRRTDGIAKGLSGLYY